MTAAVQAQLNAHKAAPQAPRGPSGTTVPPAGVRAVVGRETAKEQPGPRANTPLRWQVAGGLHTEQFPGEFRLVVIGNEIDKEKVINALENIV